MCPSLGLECITWNQKSKFSEMQRLASTKETLHSTFVSKTDAGTVF